MKISFIFVGKTKSGDIANLEAKYIKLLGRYTKISVIFTKESKLNNWNKSQEIEWKDILRRISWNDYLILLSEKWDNYDSISFSKYLNDTFLLWKNIVFVVWGAFWHWSEILERSDKLLSFSKMTFTHELIRPILFEQIYRAYNILNGGSYHK